MKSLLHTGHSNSGLAARFRWPMSAAEQSFPQHVVSERYGWKSRPHCKQDLRDMRTKSGCFHRHDAEQNLRVPLWNGLCVTTAAHTSQTVDAPLVRWVRLWHFAQSIVTFPGSSSSATLRSGNGSRSWCNSIRLGHFFAHIWHSFPRSAITFSRKRYHPWDRYHAIRSSYLKSSVCLRGRPRGITNC